MNFDYNTNNWLPMVVLIIVFFVLVILGMLDTFWGHIKSFLFLDNIYGDCAYDDYSKHNFKYVSKKCEPHLHKWAYWNTTRHDWAMICGKPRGKRLKLDVVIQGLLDKPGHSETSVETIRGWKDSGFEVCFTSWNNWKCNICGEKKSTEFYCNPSKEDKSMDEYNINVKKQTQQINTYRREIAVEQMKRYV